MVVYCQVQITSNANGIVGTYYLLVVMTAMLLCWEKQFPTFFVWIALCANLIELDAPPTAECLPLAPIVAFVGQSNNHTS